MRFAIIIAMMVSAAPLWAEGFAQTNFTKVRVENDRFAGGPYQHTKKRASILVTCDSCDDGSHVNVLLGSSTDGTEGRIRSGETTFKHMEKLCKRNASSCQLKRLDVGPAIGWLTKYRLGNNYGSTAILLLDGDMLTIRAVSGRRSVTRKNMDAALSGIAPQIVGRQ